MPEHRHRAFVYILLFSVALSYAGEGARPNGFLYPPKMDGCREETYKEIDGTKLNVYIFEDPAAAAAKAHRPAIVFFFGGGWQAGSPAQFEKQCRHFASRGMVAITADYRVGSRNKAKASQCVADAKSCLRWVRKNAERLGIDAERLVAAGGSAGGHLAAATAFVPGFDEKDEDIKIRCIPNALVLFNPALILAPLEGVELKGFGTNLSSERLGGEPAELSPAHHIKPGAPPTLILHGKADTTVPYFTAEAFAERMKKSGNQCVLVGYEGQPHSFFNVGKYSETLAEADAFLVGLKYLEPAK